MLDRLQGNNAEPLPENHSDNRSDSDNSNGSGNVNPVHDAPLLLSPCRTDGRCICPTKGIVLHSAKANDWASPTPCQPPCESRHTENGSLMSGRQGTLVGIVQCRRGRQGIG